MSKFTEPPVKGKLKWNDELPCADFPAAAEIVDVVVYEGRAGDLALTITSLMAVVNSEKPRIAIAEDGRTDPFDTLGIKFKLFKDPYELFEKYKEYMAKAVIWDKACEHTANLASTFAGLEDAIVVTAEDYDILKKAGIELDIIADYRGMFDSKLAVYNYMYDKYYPRCTRKLITSVPPGTSTLRDYSMAVKSAIIFLEFKDEEGKLADKFFSKCESGNSAVLGWAPDGDEKGIVTCASLNGLYVWASDHSLSMSYFAANRGVTPKLPLKSVDQYVGKDGKVKPFVYVAIAISDGDNLQYMQRDMFDWFNNRLHRHKKMPALSWTINPAACDIIPVIYNYFVSPKQLKKYPDDGYLTGPSGIGYYYPYKMFGSKKQDDLLKFVEQTNRYCKKTGINTVSVWFEAVQDPEIPEDFMKAVAPKLSDVSAMLFQRRMNSKAVDSVAFWGWNDPYNDNPVVNFQKEIKMAVDTIAENPNKAEYVSLQAVPWDTKMLKHFLQVRKYADNLNSGKVKGKDIIKYVTVDQLVQLQRIEIGLPRTNAEDYT